MTSSWFFLSTLNYGARSTTHQIYKVILLKPSPKREWPAMQQQTARSVTLQPNRVAIGKHDIRELQTSCRRFLIRSSHFGHTNSNLCEEVRSYVIGCYWRQLTVSATSLRYVIGKLSSRPRRRVLAVAALDKSLSMVWCLWHISVSQLCCWWSMAVCFWVASITACVCFGVPPVEYRSLN